MTGEHSDLITMADMAAVFDVTDALGIDRELVRVELTKEDPGSVGQNADGEVEITLPLAIDAAAWGETLRAELLRIGYTPAC